MAVLALAVGVLAVARGDRLLLAWVATAGALSAGLSWWARTAWRGVAISCWFERARSLPGEANALRIRIVNEKRMALPAVELRVWLEGGLSTAALDEPERREVSRRLSLPGSSDTTITVPVQAAARGEYGIERLEVRVTDPFRLAVLHRELHPEASLLVLPAGAWAGRPRIVRRLPFGLPHPSARLFEEREYFAGVREYVPGDPLNQIHWRLTAHAGALQTKLFDPTRSAELLIAIDVADGEPHWQHVQPELAEVGIEQASEFAREALETGSRLGIVANTHLRHGRGAIRVPTSAARGHEATVFAALGMMPNQPTSELAFVLREEGRRLARRSTVVVISSNPGRMLRRELEVLRARGCSVVLVRPGASPRAVA